MSKPETSRQASDAKPRSLHEVLDSLRDRFKERVRLCRENEEGFARQKNYSEAQKAAQRADVWGYAADMVEQEKLSNVKLCGGATKGQDHE